MRERHCQLATECAERVHVQPELDLRPRVIIIAHIRFNPVAMHSVGGQAAHIQQTTNHKETSTGNRCPKCIGRFLLLIREIINLFKQQ